MPLLRDLVQAAAQWFPAIGKAAPRGAGALANLLGGGYSQGYVDAFRKQRAPTPLELVQEYRGVPYACAHKNAITFASVPFRLYVQTAKGQRRAKCPTRPVSRAAEWRLRGSPSTGLLVTKARKLEEVTDHPLLSLLKRPNPHTNRFDLLDQTQAYQEVVGNAYWYLFRDGLGVPGEIWMLPAHFVVPQANPGSGNVVDYYQLRGTQGSFTQCRPDEIVHFRMPALIEPNVLGWSPLRAAIERVGLSDKELATVQAQLDNQGRPDAAFTPAEMMSWQEAQRLERKFNLRFRRGGQGGILVMESGGEIKPLQFSPRDLASLEVLGMTKNDIANAFDVPLALLEGKEVNRATLDAARSQHAHDAIQPRCCRMEQALNSQLVPLYDPSGRLLVAYDNPVPEDLAQELQKCTVYLQQGVITRAEVRAQDGLEPLPGMDVALIPITMQPVGDDGLPIRPDPPAMPPGMGRPGGDPAAPASREPQKPTKRLERLHPAIDEAQERPARAAVTKPPAVLGNPVPAPDPVLPDGRAEGQSPDTVATEPGTISRPIGAHAAVSRPGPPPSG